MDRLVDAIPYVWYGFGLFMGFALSLVVVFAFGYLIFVFIKSLLIIDYGRYSRGNIADDNTGSIGDVRVLANGMHMLAGNVKN